VHLWEGANGKTEAQDEDRWPKGSVHLERVMFDWKPLAFSFPKSA
jgi:hypothetical protein